MSTTFLSNQVVASACSTATLQPPVVYGAKILSMTADLVTNFTTSIHVGLYINHGSVEVQGANFCNVSVSYTHPGYNDTINVQVYLPQDNWNGRMQAIGGGGWQAGLNYPALSGMAGAMGEGYASLSTDAGLGSTYEPDSWALLSPGNINWALLQDLAAVSLNDASLIGKSLVNSYYGQPPVYSYWTGCSQGGRQGMMLAQRYPDAFDGIVASAPAINWNELFVLGLWPVSLMNDMSEYPHACEFQAITSATIEACDGNDGIIDGVITDSDSCLFDPKSLIGTIFNCTDTGENMQISSAAVTLVRKIWAGPKKADNSTLWGGYSKDAILATEDTSAGGSVALTTCAANGTCIAAPASLMTAWIRYFILKNPDADISNITSSDLYSLYHSSVQQYGSVMGTNDPDLSAFRDRGGKLLGYHGLADGIISPYSSKHYYDAVTALDPNVHDYYRLFLAPGLEHCFGGSGAYPYSTFDTLRTWVENGTAPDTLSARTFSVTPEFNRTLCPYPKKQFFNGTTVDTADGVGFFCK